MTAPQSVVQTKTYTNALKIAIPSAFTPSGRYRDQLAVLSSVLLRRTVTIEERRKGFFVPCSAESFWIPLFGRNYIRIKEDAVAKGLIELNTKYAVKRFPQSCRLTKQNRDWSWKLFYISKKPTIKRCIEWNKKERARLRGAGRYLEQCFDRFVLSIDPRQLSDQHLWVAYLVMAVEQRQHFASRCQYGRFHSCFTALPRTVRQSIATLDGKPTYEADVSNCQPLILGMIIERRCNAIDVKEFNSLCSQGQLNEFLQKRIVGEEYVDPKGKLRRRRKTRDYVKEQFFKMVFGTISQTRRNPCFDVFQKHFPNVARHVIEMKESDYRSIARECQRLESEIMIDACCEQYKARGIPVLTVHDSAIASRCDIDEVRQIMLDSFKRYGTTPRINPSW